MHNSNFAALLTSSTAAQAHIAAKVLNHFGRDDIPIGVGPSTEEPPCLAPDDTGHLLFSDSCAPGYDMETEPNGAVPNPILKEWGAARRGVSRAFR